MQANPLSQTLGPDGETCGSCVWHYLGGRGHPVERCRRHGGERIGAEAAACPSHTTALDCLQCGACCREAYDVVEVGARDPFVKQHPARLIEVDGRLILRRRNNICGCLAPEEGTWTCVVYADRPKTCRDFEVGSINCVTARVRLGLTP